MHKLSFHLFCIIAIGVLVYSNTLNVPFTFDDIHNIVENPLIRDIESFWGSAHADGSGGISFLESRRFVGFLSFALNYAINGLNVPGYHVVNVLIHLMNALLVYVLVVLTGKTPFVRQFSDHDPSFADSGPQFTGFIALFSALLFVSHPVQTQAVTYIVQRFASLAVFFYLLSIVLYVKSRLSSIPKWTITWYFLSLMSAVLAMKTKEIAFTLPVIIVVYEILFFQGKIKERVRYLLPVSLTILIIPISLIGINTPIGEMIGDVHETTRVQTTMSRWDYLFTQFRVIVTYVRLFLFPVNQNLDYDYPAYHEFFQFEVLASFVLLLILTGGALYALYRSRVPACRSQIVGFCLRIASLGILWFFITISVESSVIPIVDVMFEHRVYLPSVGVFIALSACLYYLFHKIGVRWPQLGKYRVLTIGIMIMIVSVATYTRNKVWSDEVSLWSDVVQKSPLKTGGYNSLGVAYKERGLSGEAKKYFDMALRLDPYNFEAHNNLGNIYIFEGKYDEAIAHYEIILSASNDGTVMPGHFSDLYYNVGIAYGSKGETDKAIGYYKKAIRINPNNVDAYNNLGVCYFSQGLVDKAIEQYLTAVRLDPNHIYAYFNLGESYLEQGATDMAIRYLVTFLQFKPEYAEAYYYLGNAYLAQGAIQKALDQYNKALMLQYDHPALYENLGRAYKKAGEDDKADEYFREAEEGKKRVR